MERCTVIGERAELETFARPNLANPDHAFSTSCAAQKSCAKEADFCDIFGHAARLPAVTVRPDGRHGWAVSAGGGVELRDCRGVPWMLEPKRHADRGPAGM